MSETIIRSEFSDIMQKSYIDYAMSVICQRAVPDVRDGLKPVQRRVLYAMQELGLSPDKPHRKSARIVGDTMGKYHPHGDSSIYEALVVMEQDFKKGMPLVDGHGNFGSIEGDGAAAMRYTEAKLQKFTQEVFLADLDKDVVDYVSNFDETEKEPEVLPVRIPNLLINGAEGIAVGMTTSIPPHNLNEVVDGVMAYMDNPDITTEELMHYVKGPDFPTGGIVVNQSELLDIYTSGTGKIRLRGKVVYEPAKKRSEKDKLVITEIPYPMIGANIGKFISDIVALIENKKTSDIVDVSNESSKEGIRIVLELRKNADVEKLKNLLYKKTHLEDSFGVNMLAIAEGRPEVLGLKDIIKHHTKFHYEIVTRKYRTMLDKLLVQKEIKEGLIAACDMIDLIIEILRGSHNLAEAKACLISGDTGEIRFKSAKSKKAASKLCFTERQATAILEMRLYKLIGLEILALQSEYADILNKIREYEDILNNPASMKKVIKKDLAKIKKDYGFERRTELTDAKAAVCVEEAPEVKDMILVMDRFGYCKLLETAVFDKNKETVENEYRRIIPVRTDQQLCLFTQTGVMHKFKAADVPAGKLRDKGVPVDNIANYDSQTEQIILVINEAELEKKRLLFVTRSSMVKLVEGNEFSVSKKTIAATKLNEDDALVAVQLVDTKKDSKNISMVLQSEDGYFLRFSLSEIGIKKKTAVGVRGMSLKDNDRIKAVYLLDGNGSDSITYKDKDLALSKIRLMNRDSRGVKVRR